MPKRDRTRKGSTKSAVATGEEIWDAADNEEKRQEQRAAERASGIDRLFRFSIPMGEAREVVILEEDVRDGIALYEHNMKDQKGHWSVYEVCPKEFANCPVCAKEERDSSFVLYISVLVLDAYQDKTTKEWRNSRNLFGIKHGQLKTFKKVFAAAKKQHGTLRGVVLNLERPKGQAQNSPRIGEPVEFEDTGTRFDFIADLEEEYGHEAIVGKDGKTVVKEANLDITPFDWEQVFPMAFDVDALVKDLRERYGDGASLAGSTDEVLDEFSNEADETENKAPSKRRRRAVPKGEAADDSEPEAEAEEAEAEAPRSRRRKRV